MTDPEITWMLLLKANINIGPEEQERQPQRLHFLLPLGLS